MSTAQEIEYVRGLLVRAVEEKGADYVYPDEQKTPKGQLGDDLCMYVHDGAPSCIVGHVLHYAGVELEKFEPWEGSRAEIVGEALTEWHPSVLKALGAAQEAQDGGKTWGKALDAFDSHLSAVPS
jgi:hypothetical protein